MFLKKLSVLNYKNIKMQELTFSPYINCFIGNNGVGKTNLLDAIYHLGMGKSYFNTLAIQNITHNQDFYLLEGFFSRQQREENIVCSVKKGQKKQIKRNGKAYERIADHIGNFPMVIVSPADRNLVTEGSEERRRFLDGVISLTNSSYLSTLISYNKILAQRNSLLKYFAENQTFDTNALQVYNEQLSWFGEEIYMQRKTFLDNFLPVFQEQYQIISGGKEKVSITYQTTLAKHRLTDLLLQSQTKDCAVQYTTCGIHKDDLLFEIEGHMVKKFASQGQQKSFLIALKLAQFHIIRKKTEVTPILLLDDIFDKLDTLRVEQLIKLVSEENFGQIFLTDTHLERTKQIVQQIFKEYKIIEF
ncbi:DNA replication/repair protein RecF [Capnocytophaga catalasegens]|uniref:DNA replication and repair protein RecF n=1 Tax=Capnocytophaga catalasegens TaxID=1004260 RepID=A0AAV5AVK6_9FLAO|nr:DNA replication and repair protein RecF [Capnocytophaga catalasegens]GIZ15010.1 DNA replication and repair protein RecF [Capnocytophaga catalasegens]GJM49390.1 DNA replication and repair protein RecF [Capnocytophaga catalasegens]GJM52540.1 DNA replication and repair protein RecF [Capnocytophaga catalasegens]